VKREPTWTARKMATKSSQVARVDGVWEGRSCVVVRYVVAEGGIGFKDNSEAVKKAVK
jgi:hypothetical protein